MTTIYFLFKIFMWTAGIIMACMVINRIFVIVFQRYLLNGSLDSIMAIGEPDHTDIDFSKLPAKLKKLIAKYEREIQSLGYQHLLTGERRKIREGGSDCFYYTLVTKDQSAILEFLHLRTPRYLFGLIEIPYSRWHGPVTLHVGFETRFHEVYALRTSTISAEEAKELNANASPDVRHQPGENLSLAQLEQVHRDGVQSLVGEGKSVIAIDSAETHLRLEAEARMRTTIRMLESLARMLKEAEEQAQV